MLWSVPVIQLFFIYCNQNISLRVHLFLFFDLLLHVEQSENTFKNKRAKRRHARPLELNSDDESKAEATAGCEEVSEKPEAAGAAHTSPLVRRFWILSQLCEYRENHTRKML